MDRPDLVASTRYRPYRTLSRRFAVPNLKDPASGLTPTLRLSTRRVTAKHIPPAAVIAAGLALAILGSWAAALPAGNEGPVVCPFRAATGHPCPTCGLIRTAHSALRGDIGAAWAVNPFDAFFLTIAVPVAAVLAALYYLRGIALEISLSRKERIFVWWVAGSCLAANWIYVLRTQG